LITAIDRQKLECGDADIAASLLRGKEESDVELDVAVEGDLAKKAHFVLHRKPLTTIRLQTTLSTLGRKKVKTDPCAHPKRS
jgi:hypothetical protein